jgi:hypothetical protein
MNYIRLVTATVNDPMVAATNYYVLKAATKGAINTGTSISP